MQNYTEDYYLSAPSQPHGRNIMSKWSCHIIQWMAELTFVLAAVWLQTPGSQLYITTSSSSWEPDSMVAGAILGTQERVESLWEFWVNDQSQTWPTSIWPVRMGHCLTLKAIPPSPGGKGITSSLRSQHFCPSTLLEIWEWQEVWVSGLPRGISHVSEKDAIFHQALDLGIWANSSGK